MAKRKYRKIWNSKEERDAWNAHVDQTLRRLRYLIDRAWADLEKKNPELRNL